MTSYAATITRLRGDELPVTPGMRAQAFWLLKKYSSMTYIGRMMEIYSAVVGAYERYALHKTGSVTFERENLARLFMYKGLLQEGIDEVLQGYKRGYANIREGSGFGEWLMSRRFADDLLWDQFGWRPHGPSTGFGAWLALACNLAQKVDLTLSSSWTFPRILDPAFGPFGFPDGIDAPPAPKRDSVRTLREVSTAGIWVPDDDRMPCPNYLVEGRPAPNAQRVSKQVDWPETPPFGYDPGSAAHTTYENEEEQTTWRLLWVDDRYAAGKIPEMEAVYLDPSTEPPPWAPDMLRTPVA